MEKNLLIVLGVVLYLTIGVLVTVAMNVLRAHGAPKYVTIWYAGGSDILLNLAFWVIPVATIPIFWVCEYVYNLVFSDESPIDRLNTLVNRLSRPFMPRQED